jgi:hypothetical protein
VPSAPVAVIATEAALVVCQLNVTACPEAMLLLLAEKTRVGADVFPVLPEPEDEPEPQPVKAISDEIAANPNRVIEHVARAPIRLRLEDEICRSRLLLRILLPPLVSAWNVSLLKRESIKATISTTTVLRPIPIPFPFADRRQAGKPCGPK